MTSINQLFNREQSSALEASGSQPIVLMGRIRLARNLNGFFFPGWSDRNQRERVFNQCKQAIENVPQISPSVNFDIEALDEMERMLLVEKHLISKELSEGQPGSGVVIHESQQTSIMINEEDHLRIQVMSPGLAFDELWQSANTLDDELEKRLDYAYHEKFGYITACPTNLGTAMRASAMLHLPALVVNKEMEKVVRAVNQLGIVSRGLFGESSDPLGSIFQISNQQTLGETEDVIIQRLHHVLETIIEQEQYARIRLFEQDRAKVMDRISRAFGVLKFSKLLSSSEAMNLLSLLRLASDVNVLPVTVREIVDSLFIQIQPAHLQFSNKRVLDTEARDELRALRVKEVLKDIPEPDEISLDFEGSFNKKVDNFDRSR